MSNISFSFQKPRGSVSPFKSPTALQLRELVLDYLCHQCYTNTARAFIHDSTVKELDADGDEILAGPESESLSPISASESPLSESPSVLLKQVEQRREIRELILAGRVGHATDLLNEYFPSVLSDSLPLSPEGPSQTDNAPTSNGSFAYVSSTSMEPAHLVLNLRILSFIESCRTRPLEIPSHKAPGSTGAFGKGRETFPVPMDTSEGPVPDSPQLDSGVISDDARMEILISKGKKLYGLLQALPDAKERELYDKELGNVAGLLGYKTPEDSPVAKYLSFERREALADQINRAALHRSGLSPISSVEILTRYTTVLWQAARSHGVKARSGAVLPPTSSKPSTPAAPSGSAAKPEDIINEEVPAFDLKLFLDAKP